MIPPEGCLRVPVQPRQRRPEGGRGGAQRLTQEYRRLVSGFQGQGVLPEGEGWLAAPVLPDDILKEAVGAPPRRTSRPASAKALRFLHPACRRGERRAPAVQVPGNIRRAEHFVAFLRRFLAYLKQRMGVSQVAPLPPPRAPPPALLSPGTQAVGVRQAGGAPLPTQVESSTTDAFLAHMQTQVNIDGEPAAACARLCAPGSLCAPEGLCASEGPPAPPLTVFRGRGRSQDAAVLLRPAVVADEDPGDHGHG